MATQTLTADGTLTFILSSPTSRQTVTLDALFSGGSFGGGTAAIYKREGSTGGSIAILDSSGAAITATSSKQFCTDIVAGNSTIASEQSAILVTLTGSTSPSLRVTVNCNIG